jgi:hypothetical protein
MLPKLNRLGSLTCASSFLASISLIVHKAMSRENSAVHLKVTCLSLVTVTDCQLQFGGQFRKRGNYEPRFVCFGMIGQVMSIDRRRTTPDHPRTFATCSIADHHIDPRRSALFMARSVLRYIRNGVLPC